jgi:hypothetical protein
MSSLYLLERYEHEFNLAKDKYKEIMKWIIENRVLMDIFMPRPWQDKCLTLEGLIELYNQLHWSLYDDGDVTFIKTNNQPIL